MLTFNGAKTTENQSQAATHDQQLSTPTAPDASAQKKTTSPKKIEANRRNSRRSTGPHDTRRTRYNPTRHGLRAQGLTPWDNVEEYERDLRDLTDTYRPSGPLNRFLVRHMAIDMVRSRRVAGFEADAIVASCSTADTSSDPTSDGRTPTIQPGAMLQYTGPTLYLLQRYNSATVNRLIRSGRELERKRQEEPAPQITLEENADGDVTV